MKVRNHLLSTVGLMLAGAMGLSSFAHAAEILQPDSNWAISKISASAQAGGGAYCALARRFSNDMVLTFARNNKDESSLALDFQKNSALSPDTNYYVVLKPGTGQDRSFNVTPVSGRALVVRLGKDYPFYDALGRAQHLDVKVAADTYSFSMADFSTGQEEMNACLANLPTDKSNNAVAAATPAPVPEVAKKSTKTAVAPHAAAGPKMAAIPVTPVDATPVESLSESSSHAMANKLIADDMVSDRTNIAHKASTPIAPTAMADNTEQMQSLQEENAKLRAALEDERRTYENQLQTQGKSSSFVAELNEKVSTLQKENDTLRHQVASTDKPGVGATVAAAAVGGAGLVALQADNSHLKSELASLHDQLAADDKKTADAATKLSEANAKLDTANQKITDADKRIAMADQKASAAVKQSAQPTAADKQLADANAKLDAANKKLVDADQRIADAEKTKADLSYQLTLDGNADEKLAEANKKLAEADHKMAAATKSMQLASAQPTPKAAVAPVVNPDDHKLTEAAQKLAEANQREAEANQKLAQVSAKESTAEQKLAEANQKLLDAAKHPAMASPVVDKQQAALVSSLQTQLQSLQSENTSLKEAVKTAQATSAASVAPAAGNDTTPAQLHAIEQQLSSVEQDRDRLKHQVDALSASGGGNAHTINVATNDWNLEEATRRYNEAERQIRTMGVQLEQQQGICEADKKKIEYQLFDPAIATQAQIQKVSALEQQIDKDKADLAIERQRIADLQTKMATSRVTSAVAVMPSTAGTISPQPINFVQPKVSAPPVVAKPVVAKPVTIKATVAPTKPALPQTAALSPMPASDLAKIETAAGEPNAPVVDGGLAVGQISSRDISAIPLPAPMVAVNAQPPVSAAEAPPAPINFAKVAQATNAMVESPQLISTSDLQAFLDKTIPLKGGVTKVENVSRPGFVAYKWQSGSLFGSAEQQALGGPSGFDTHVAEYLAKTKTHCAGTFAAKPGVAQDQDGTRVAAYEIACVGDGKMADSSSAAASVLFFSRNGIFTTIAHEGTVDDMDVAMDTRDKVLGKVLQTKVASNDLK